METITYHVGMLLSSQAEQKCISSNRLGVLCILQLIFIMFFKSNISEKLIYNHTQACSTGLDDVIQPHSTQDNNVVNHSKLSTVCVRFRFGHVTVTLVLIHIIVPLIHLYLGF